eukprot:SAG25_NODE_13180_length_270_cov_0.877193_1_plen_42_part_10
MGRVSQHQLRQSEPDIHNKLESDLVDARGVDSLPELRRNVRF